LAAADLTERRFPLESDKSRGVWTANARVGLDAPASVTAIQSY